MVEKAPDAFRTISEVADDLDLPQHVLRFWETRFAQIKPMKRGGGRRYYRPDDIDLLRGIRHLLYGEGYTIRGVQRLLKDEGIKFVQAVWKTGAPQPVAKLDAEVDADVDDEFEESDQEPGRGLLGLWPALLGGSHDADEGDDEPPERIEPATDFGEASQPAVAALEPAADHGSGPKAGADGVRAKSDPGGEAAFPAGAGELPRDAILKLQATLFELSECRRLIDAAATDDP